MLLLVGLFPHALSIQFQQPKKDYFLPWKKVSYADSLSCVLKSVLLSEGDYFSHLLRRVGKISGAKMKYKKM